VSEATLPTGIVADTPDVPASTASREAGPVRPQERIQLVDVLRGFALLGILVANWSYFPALKDMIEFFVAGSFYTTYSFLFGLGFAIQLLRAEEGKRPFILRYLWRILILFVIGVAHFVFIWRGDILRIYALVAIVLLLVRRWGPSLILALAAAFLVISMSSVQVPAGHVWTRINPEQVEAERLQTQLSTATARANRPAWCDMIRDPWGGDVCSRAAEVRTLLTRTVATVQWWMCPDERPGLLCMFLLGLYAGRQRILRDTAQHTRFFFWVAGVTLVFGLAGNALDVFGDFFTGKGIALPKALDGWRLAYSLGNIGLSLFYLSSVALLFTHWRLARRVLAPLAYVGRMGLTNYLVQSLFFMNVLGFRDGLWSRIQGWHSVLLMSAFFVVQILYSRWWFRHFQFGPMEWAWRSLTWFRVQPMRIARAGGEIPPA
jgi:uncharacterized protein